MPALAQQALNPHAEIATAETNINISVGFMHEQYSEGPPDAENGYAPGFGIGASTLLPSAFPNIDLYSELAYKFNAGNLTYNGHYSGLPLTATDRAVFNHIEGRFGLGFPIAGGAVEMIPFITGGYMAWNRNVDIKHAIGSDEFYSTGLVGGGLKLDVPVTPALVLSGTAQLQALVGTHLSANDLGIGWDLGSSGMENLSYGMDYALQGPLHIQADADWTHFTYAGSKPTARTYYFYEPLSNTTQFGVNLGVSYSF